VLRLVWSWPVTAVVDVAVIAALHAGSGYLAHRLGPDALARDGIVLRAKGFEDGGRWYRRVRIDRWKDRVPEAGALFPGGVSKRELPGRDPVGLELFVRETRRAELTHWWAMSGGAVFVLFNPPASAVPLLAYSVVVNLPFVAIQRYNRLRALSVLARRAGRT
jgi:glycosyl-4,4'-diaponeurosporenoate acyltransferase